MKPLQVLLILRAHYKVALVVFVLTVLVGLGISLQMPKQYITTTSMVFDIKSADPVAGAILPVAPGYMATQVDIIKSDHLAQQVASSLKLDQNPAVIKSWKDSTGSKSNLREWLGDLLQKGLRVTPSGVSNIIEISFAAGDPRFAAAVANAYAQAYIDANIEFKVDPARQYALWFGEQAKVMRENLEKAQAKLSEYQQEKGIVAKDEQSDAETAKLNDLYAQLSAAQGQTVDIRSKANSGADELSDVTQSSLLQSLKSEIAHQEAKLREAGENLGKNHPQYQRMEAEIAALKSQLELEKINIARGLSASKSVAIDKESQIRAAIAAQKKKLLELKGGRDQLAVLQRDVDAAQSAYDNVIRRYNQTSLESQVTQTNVSVLNPAIEPTEPASPNFRKNMLVSLALGLLLGGGTAFLLELLDRRIRSADDLAEMLQVPVLAVIESHGSNRLIDVTRQKLRLEFK